MLTNGPEGGTRSNVRFGSKADMCSAADDVRFTPNSDRKSRHPQNIMSALLPIADMCGAHAHVCFGPKADIYRFCDPGDFFSSVRIMTNASLITKTSINPMPPRT